MNKEMRLNDSNREKWNSKRRPKLIEQIKQITLIKSYVLKTIQTETISSNLNSRKLMASTHTYGVSELGHFLGIPK
jgi:hypothetical protein